jgi:hypothetical protein
VLKTTSLYIQQVRNFQSLMRVCRDGCQIDHLRIDIEVKITSRRAEANSVGSNAKKNMRPKLNINADLLKVTEKCIAFQSIISEAITHKPNYSTLASNIVIAAKKLAAEEDRLKPDWFERKNEELASLITVRNNSHYAFIKRSSQRNLVRLQDAHRLLKRTKRRTKREWQR